MSPVTLYAGFCNLQRRVESLERDLLIMVVPEPVNTPVQHKQLVRQPGTINMAERNEKSTPPRTPSPNPSRRGGRVETPSASSDATYIPHDRFVGDGEIDKQSSPTLDDVHIPSEKFHVPGMSGTAPESDTAENFVAPARRSSLSWASLTGPLRHPESIYDSSLRLHSRAQSVAESTRPIWRPDTVDDGTLSTHSRGLSLGALSANRPHTRIGVHGESDPDRCRSRQSDSDTISILSDILQSFEPSLSRLASDASTRRKQSIKRWSQQTRPSQIMTPIVEQRRPGKEGARLSRCTQDWDPNAVQESDSVELQTAGDTTSDEEDAVFLSGLPLLLLIMGLCLVVSLISIDRTIITTVSAQTLRKVGFTHPLLGNPIHYR
jgi:hypothetical protein